MRPAVLLAFLLSSLLAGCTGHLPESEREPASVPPSTAAGIPPLSFTLDVEALHEGRFEGEATFSNPTGETFHVHPFQPCGRLEFTAQSLDGRHTLFPTLAYDCVAGRDDDATLVAVPAGGQATVPFQSYGGYEGLERGEWVLARLTYRPTWGGGDPVTLPTLQQHLTGELIVRL